MARRPSITLLFVGSGQIVRADFSGPPDRSLIRLWQEPMLPTGACEDRARAAMRLGGRPGQNVWILDETTWTQTLTLPAGAAAGLNRAQLAQALSYEVDALSGINDGDTAVGFKALPSPRGDSAVFWVSHVSAQTRRAVQDVIAEAGGTLRGILHPGGLPVSIEEPQRSRWKRIELWRGTTLCLHQDSPGGMGIHVVLAEPSRENWRREMSRWHGQTNGAPGEWLGVLPGEDGLEFLSSDERWAALPPLKGTPLEAWLTNWARSLDCPSPAVPVIEAGATIVKLRHYVAATIAMLLLAAVAVASHLLWTRSQIAGTQSELSVLQKPRKELDELKQSAQAMRTELEQMTKSNEAAQAALRRPSVDLSSYRRSILGLFTEFSRRVSEGVVIDRISTDGEGAIRLHGFALRPEAADQYALRLSEALGSCGWIVSPAEKEARRTETDGGPWVYSIRVAPQAGSTPAQTAQPTHVTPGKTREGLD